MFLAFLFFFAKFFSQKFEYGNGVTKIGNGVTKMWILVTYAPYTPPKTAGVPRSAFGIFLAHYF